MSDRDIENGGDGARFVVGVDIGGTFTDAVAIDPRSGVTRVGKALTVPGKEEEGARAAIADSGVSPEQISEVVHGHTVGINAVLARGGSTVGVLATAGYRDLLDVGRFDRPVSEMWNLRWVRPHQERPIAPRRLRRGVPGRIAADGEELLPLDLDAAREAVEALRSEGAESFAVCLMNSYVDPTHEDQVAALVREIAPDAYVQTSEVYPLPKEAERTTTVALDAYTGPLIIDYLSRFDERLHEAGLDGPIWIMGMNGGVAAIGESKRFPIMQLMSGPVGGVAHAVSAAEVIGKALVTLDMGGTSTDVSVIHDGAPTHTDHWRVEWGLDLYLPMIEIDTIGAGAGSIVSVDEVGVVSVGPRSAGSVPGPACYGRGGTEPAVTDAFVVLGLIQPEFFFGGQMKLDLDAAATAMSSVAAKAGSEAAELAEAVNRLAVAHIAESIRTISTYRGLDIRGYGLVAGGAAGPLVAARVARELEMEEAIIPREPGQFSALGLAVADVRVNEAAPAMRAFASYGPADFDAAFATLEDRARERIADQGLGEEEIRLARSFRGMYAGQTWDNSYPAPSGPYDAEAMEEIALQFHALYEQRSGSSSAELPIMVTAFQVTAEVSRHAPDQYVAAKEDAADGRPLVVRPVLWEGKFYETPFVERQNLPVGEPFAGPAVVVERHATTAVPPEATVTRAAEGHLVLRWNAKEVG
jgi:N-methylhydantoinase A